LRGRLHVPTGRRNFADFDYAAYLARRHIHVLARTDTLEVLRSNCSSGLNRIQLYVGQALSRHVASDEVRAISRALLLGDRSGLSDDVRTQFADTGLMHLLAISGLHVMLLGLAIHRLLGPVLRRLGWRWSYVEAGRLGVTGLVLVGYALVTGAPASVVRAVVMAGFLAVAPLVARTSRPYNALGGAALVLLAWRPGFVFDAGFQLSFSAVGALLYLTPAFECWTPAWVDRRARFVASSIRASLAATLGTLPVLLWHFGQVGWGGLVLNLPAIPLTAGLLGASTLTALTAPFPFASASFGAAADVCGRILLWTAEWGQAGFGWAQTKGMIQNPLWAAVLVSGLVALGATSVRVRYRGAVCALLLASVVLWAGIGAHRYEPALDVVFFDVGQGDAALVRFPDGAGVLIDAGPASQYTNAGERAVLPHVAAHGIESIDAALVSHPHLDHYGGFAAVLREMPVGRLITNGQMSASPLYRGLLASADSLGVPVQAVRAGDTLQISPTARIEVLHPTHKPAEDEDPNEASLVVRVRYGSCSILFMGDAEAGAEHALLSMYGDRLRTDMVKVGHHGSKTSSTPDFVQATRARTAIVSVASRNRYGLPDEEALRTWDRAGADVIETRQGGAVRLRCTPDGVYHFSRPR
ncbi:MAG: DNA internalization-related competence protein ComEC/Rec2, partial [Bacteroidota bacterium]